MKYYQEGQHNKSKILKHPNNNTSNITKYFNKSDKDKKVTSPAPWNTMTLSDRRLPVMRRDASSPATATDAVPWMSSLKVQYLGMNKLVGYTAF